MLLTGSQVRHHELLLAKLVRRPAVHSIEYVYTGGLCPSLASRNLKENYYDDACIGDSGERTARRIRTQVLKTRTVSLQ